MCRIIVDVLKMGFLKKYEDIFYKNLSQNPLLPLDKINLGGSHWLKI